MPFELEITATAKAEIQVQRVFDRRRIVQEIERQLIHSPDVPSKSRKRLSGIRAGFFFKPPLWELKVGDFRVFYDVDAIAHKVFIRSARRKWPGQTTEDVANA